MGAPIIFLTNSVVKLNPVSKLIIDNKIGEVVYLDSDDLLLMQKPDKRSVMTYIMMLRKGINTSNMMSRRRKKKSKPIVPTKPKLVAYDTRSKTNVVTNSGTATKKPNLVLFDTRTKNINTNKDYN